MTDSYMPWVSNSWMFDYECPRMFKYKRIDKADPDTPPSPNCVVGSAVHEAIHQMYVSQDFTLGFLFRIWPVVLREQMESYSVSETQYFATFLKEGEKLLAKFHSMAKDKGLLVDPIYTEKKLQYIVKSPAGNKYMVVCYLDLVVRPEGTDEIWIVDFKTGSTVPSQAATNSESQATFYSLGLRLVEKITESKVVFMYIRKGKWRYTARGDQEYQDLIKDIDEQQSKINNGEFEPSYSLCHICLYKDKCKMEDKAKDIPGLDPGWFK